MGRAVPDTGVRSPAKPDLREEWPVTCHHARDALDMSGAVVVTIALGLVLALKVIVRWQRDWLILHLCPRLSRP